MNFQWDTIEGGRAEISDGTLEVTRGALVSDIPASETADPYVLIRALAEAVVRSPNQAPGTAGTVLTGMVALPAKGTDQARIIATYTSPQPNNGPGVAWVIQDDSELTGERTELDITGEPLHVEYTAPAEQGQPAGGGGGGAFVINTSPGAVKPIVHPFASNVRRPVRVLSVNGYLFGRPDAAVLDCLGCANDRPWPLGSLFKNDSPKRSGCWLCSSVTASVERPGIIPQIRANQLYKVGARFSTRGKAAVGGRLIDRDWSDWGVYRNILNRIPADMVEAGEVAKVRALMAREYQVGQIHGSDRGGVNGYTKVGNYPLADFRGSFGF